MSEHHRCATACRNNGACLIVEAVERAYRDEEWDTMIAAEFVRFVEWPALYQEHGGEA